MSVGGCVNTTDGCWGGPSTCNSAQIALHGFLATLLKLFQEPDVALKEKLDVIDVVFHHGIAIHSQPKSPTRVALRIDAAMPQHLTSIHPLCLHTRQPSPLQNRQQMATSPLGSVNGKKLGWKLVLVSSPKNLRAKKSRVPFRSAKVMSLSIARPSIWWNMGEWVESGLSRR